MYVRLDVVGFLKTRFFLSIVILLQLYVLLSDVDSLRNSKLLVDAGRDIFHGRSPYTTPNPYGTWPGILYGIVDYLSFSTFTLYVIVILNLCGFALLAKYLVPKLNLQLVLIFALLTSPIRALISNVQNTGVILGSLILALFMLNKFQFSSRQIHLHLSAFLFLFAFELKPQLTLPLIALVLVQRRIFSLLASLFFQFVFIRVALDLWVGEILELEQIRIWKLMRTDPLAMKEQISPWKAMGHFFPIGVDWFALSFVFTIILIVVLIFFGVRTRSKNLEVVALMIPLASGYLHYYDLFVLLIFVIASTLHRAQHSLPGAIFSFTFLALPTHLGSHLILREVLLVLMINALLFLYVSRDFKSVMTRMFESGVALLLTSLFSTSFDSLEVALSCMLTFVFLLQVKPLIHFLKRVSAEA
jgi:hypothetical protein